MTTELVMVSSPAFKRWVAEVTAWSRYVDENKIPEYDMQRRYLLWANERRRGPHQPAQPKAPEEK